MNPEGTVYNAQGRINRLSILCITAYDIAVKHGFQGTEEEWLESLHGDSVSDEQIAEALAAYLAEHPIDSGSTATIGVVELLADKWAGSDNLYSQVVTIKGTTENSQVDLTPSVEQLKIFYEKDLTFVTENDDGVITVYAIGQKPTNDYTIQVTITEVKRHE